MKKSYRVVSVILFLGMVSTYYMGCNKTDHPFGVYAPSGLDVPSMTPTPQTGAIEIYASNNSAVTNAIQGVSIILLDPSGNTFGANTTQPVVGYAAFNPSNLISGFWTAIVPAQSVTNGSNKFTFGRSSLSVTISGAGQYAATFTTGGNSVAISPVSQIMTTGLPDFIPITVSYSENGNLDVPVSVALQGYPTIPGFSLTNPPNLILGGGVNLAAVTIVKNTCYYQTISLSLNANDFSGNSVMQSGASIVKGWPVPVTFLVCKHSDGGAPSKEHFEFEIGEPAGLDCGGSEYSIYYQTTTNNPPGGTVYGPYALAGNTVLNSVQYYASADNFVYAVVTLPNGQQLSTDQQAQYLAFDSFANYGTGSW